MDYIVASMHLGRFDVVNNIIIVRMMPIMPNILPVIRERFKLNVIGYFGKCILKLVQPMRWLDVLHVVLWYHVSWYVILLGRYWSLVGIRIEAFMVDLLALSRSQKHFVLEVKLFYISLVPYVHATSPLARLLIRNKGFFFKSLVRSEIHDIFLNVHGINYFDRF